MTCWIAGTRRQGGLVGLSGLRCGWLGLPASAKWRIARWRREGSRRMSEITREEYNKAMAEHDLPPVSQVEWEYGVERARELRHQALKLTPEQIRLTQEMPGGKEVWNPDGSLKPFAPPPLTDEQALAEMAAWLKGGRRSAAVYHRPDEALFEMWANQAPPKGVHILIPHDYSGRGATIAEAWAALKRSEGWRG